MKHLVIKAIDTDHGNRSVLGLCKVDAENHKEAALTWDAFAYECSLVTTEIGLTFEQAIEKGYIEFKDYYYMDNSVFYQVNNTVVIVCWLIFTD